MGPVTCGGGEERPCPGYENTFGVPLGSQELKFSFTGGKCTLYFLAYLIGNPQALLFTKIKYINCGALFGLILVSSEQYSPFLTQPLCSGAFQAQH